MELFYAEFVMLSERKAIPRTVVIFGAGAHIGGPLAVFLAQQAPDIRLRLVTSKPERANAIRSRFPNAEIVTANYADKSSLDIAVEGMEGAFVLTPSGTDERPAMTNLVNALRGADAAVHVIRLLGMQPEANTSRIPPSLIKHGLGLPIQHPIAKAILDDSGLPVTYLNSGATFLDNFLGMARGLREERTLIWPERPIPYIDPAEIGEVAARLLLSDDRRHIGQFHTMNNGQDILCFADVARRMTELWGEPIAYDGSRQRFFAEYAAMGERRLTYLWDFFAYEAENAVIWARNDFVGRTLGRAPRTVDDWLLAHRQQLIGRCEP
jgi:uncharacterized protein YbjT (DUF2867 family)